MKDEALITKHNLLSVDGRARVVKRSSRLPCNKREFGLSINYAETFGD